MGSPEGFRQVPQGSAGFHRVLFRGVPQGSVPQVRFHGFGSAGFGSQVRALRDAEDEEDDDRPGDDREREQRPVVARVEVQERRREQRARDRPGVIHRPMKTEHASARIGGRKAGEHGVARRAADPLAEPIGEPDRQHLRPRGREPDQRPHHRREAVAREDERLRRAPAVGQPPGQDLEPAAGRLRGPFDHAKRHRARADHLREEERQQRIDHLARHVGEEAHPPEQPDGTRETEPGTRAELMRFVQRRRASRRSPSSTARPATTRRRR